MTTSQQNNMSSNNNDESAQFLIQRIYVKDASFETPHSPQIFQQKWEPDLNLDVSTESKPLEKNVYEVTLTLTATVKTNQMVAFLAEVKQAGIFTIQGTVEAQLEHLLESFCPNILFPYAREIITTQVIHGSFPQLVLAPINFDALYMQKHQEKNKDKSTESETVN